MCHRATLLLDNINLPPVALFKAPANLKPWRKIENRFNEMDDVPNRVVL